MSGPGGTSPGGTLDRAALERTYGFAAAFFESDPSLKSLIDQAVKNQWTTDEFQARLRAPWYRNHSAAQRQWTMLSTESPAEAAKQLADKAGELMAEAT